MLYDLFKERSRKRRRAYPFSIGILGVLETRNDRINANALNTLNRRSCSVNTTLGRDSSNLIKSRDMIEKEVGALEFLRCRSELQGVEQPHRALLREEGCLHHSSRIGIARVDEES